MGSVLEAIPRGPGRTELDKERWHRGEAEGFEAERYGVPPTGPSAALSQVHSGPISKAKAGDQPK